MRISDWSSDVCSSDLLAADQDDEPWSAVEPIYVVVNGKTGPDEPARQGLASALSDGLSPLNIAGDVPTLGTGYSPLWASHPVFWTADTAVEPVLITGESQLPAMTRGGRGRGFGGHAIAAAGIVVNRPGMERQGAGWGKR